MLCELLNNVLIKRRGEMSTYEERRQARIDRYKARARNASQEASSLHDRAHKMASAIPFGQPILVGHHSERRDRRFRDRIHNTFGKAVEATEKAEYWEERAEAAENNHTISADDPEAMAKLQAKIDKAQKFQEIMKAGNKIIRKKNLTNEQKVEALIKELSIQESTAQKLLEPDFCWRVGFPDYQLTNNNANIRRMKQRLEDLKAMGTIEHKEVEHNGFKLVENLDENRIQLIFDGKPPYETRSILKHNGFRWAPSQMAWQRQLNNAGRYAAERVIEQLA